MDDNKVNKFKEQPIVASPETTLMKSQVQEPKKKLGKFWLMLREVISGEFFTNEKLKKHYGFLLFLAFIALVYIANTSYAEQNNSRIYNTKKKVRELQLEYAPIKTKMTRLEKQSVLKTILKDSTIKESTDPVKIIKIKKGIK
ncbi:MAG: hypothetical protein LBM67_07805 [Lentimicrobiaceae bacterium]|jgi:hypothetical protein|nr:hypothetical protein [Lentimicrobiaceae bacterium]